MGGCRMGSDIRNGVVDQTTLSITSFNPLVTLPAKGICRPRVSRTLPASRPVVTEARMEVPGNSCALVR
jgi:hypothetical protein